MNRGLTEFQLNLTYHHGNNLEMNEQRKVFNQFRNEYEIKSGLFYNDQSYNCKSEFREHYCSAYLGIDRKILDYLPSSRWSLVGRILQEINKKFLQESMTYGDKTKTKTEWLKVWLKFIRDKLLFSVKDESGQDVMMKFLNILQEESAKQLNLPQSDFVVDLSLYDPWNFYKTLQLIVKEQDMDLEFQASTLGMGVQASISIAILKAYSELNLANKSPIFIDEPELFLHPQAQRNFYKILRGLSEDKYDINGKLIREGTQVFYTTHSPNFLSAGNFNEIFIVRKTKDKGTFLRYAKTSAFIEDLRIRAKIETSEEDLLLRYKNAYENTGDTQKANEGFFAKKIILVEGPSEALLLPYFFDLINFDFVKEAISIVCCGGKNEIDRFYRLYSEFGIPCYVIFDGDKQLEGIEDEQDNIKKNKNILALFGEDKNYPDNEPREKFFGFEYEFEKNLGFKTSKKGLDLFIATKVRINDGSIDVPAWVEKAKAKISLLQENIESVLIKKSE
jgi:putative ATP-dependent endonuclease of the OLD family